MRSSIALFVLLLFSSFSDRPFAVASAGVAFTLPDSANTAAAALYLDAEEKRVIYYCNLARMNPKAFADTYVQPYVDSTGKKSSYTNSLLRTLRTMQPLGALQPDEQLTRTAEAHARTSGKTGKTGHSGKNGRFKKVANVYSLWGENCSYGYDRALDIVMQLLIDQNIRNLGHRKNILNPQFTHVGVAIEKHRVYRWNCVQNFGGQASR